VHRLAVYPLKGNHQIAKTPAEKLDETPRVKATKTSIANTAVWKFSLIHPHSPAYSTNSFTNGRDRNIYEAGKLSHLASIATHVLSLRSIFPSAFHGPRS
jgi:hypothetical protein